MSVIIQKNGTQEQLFGVKDITLTKNSSGEFQFTHKGKIHTFGPEDVIFTSENMTIRMGQKDFAGIEKGKATTHADIFHGKLPADGHRALGLGPESDKVRPFSIVVAGAKSHVTFVDKDNPDNKSNAIFVLNSRHQEKTHDITQGRLNPVLSWIEQGGKGESPDMEAINAAKRDPQSKPDNSKIKLAEPEKQPKTPPNARKRHAPTVDELLTKLDADHNKTINGREAHENPAAMSQLKMALDKNNDGQVDKDEIKALGEALKKRGMAMEPLVQAQLTIAPQTPASQPNVNMNPLGKQTR